MSQKKCPLAKCNNWGPLELNCNIPYTYKGYLGMPRYYRIRFVVPTVWPTASTSLSVQSKIIENHHASEGQKTKLVGGDLLEQLLMTTAPTAKQYMSMIMRG